MSLHMRMSYWEIRDNGPLTLIPRRTMLVPSRPVACEAAPPCSGAAASKVLYWVLKVGFPTDELPL